MPFKYSDPYRHKFAPLKYRINNWHQYNEALKQLGNISIWFDEQAVKNWYAARNGKRGASPFYSEIAIETINIIRLVFKLPLRQTEGFVHSIINMMKLNLAIPNFTTISRRIKTLKVQLRVPKAKDGVMIIIDSSGLAVYGADEWHKTNNGKIKFKGYRKINIAINENQEIIACELTTKHGDDIAQVKKMIRKNKFKTFIADGNYDSRSIYSIIKKHQKKTAINIVIPPRCDGRARKIKTRVYPEQRSDHIRFRNKHGKINWQKHTGYGKRSLVEVAFHRYKKIIGKMMHAIKLSSQRAEAKLACKILNIMANLGMPETVKIR